MLLKTQQDRNMLNSCSVAKKPVQSLIDCPFRGTDDNPVKSEAVSCLKSRTPCSYIKGSCINLPLTFHQLMGEHGCPSAKASQLYSNISQTQKQTSSPSPETQFPVWCQKTLLSDGCHLWAAGAGYTCPNFLPNNKHCFLICPCVSVVFFFPLKASSPPVGFWG